jgi:hypothetical protein
MKDKSGRYHLVNQAEGGGSTQEQVILRLQGVLAGSELPPVLKLPKYVIF